MFELFFFIMLLLLGFIIGKSKERKHYRSIGIREETFLGKPAITARVPSSENIAHADLAIGSVVVSIDYFKIPLILEDDLRGGVEGLFPAS